MAAKPISPLQTPLDTFLAQASENNYETGLTFLAKVIAAAEPFSADLFGRELLAKLKRLKYPQPERPMNDKTFEEKLAAAGVLDALLHPDTLLALWKCTLLRKIAERDRKLEQAREAVTGKPLKFHRRQSKEMKKKLAELEELQETYAVPESDDKLHLIVTREYRRHLRSMMLSTKYRGSRAEMLTGSPAKGLRGVPKSEELAANIAIYRVLTQALRPDSRIKRRLSGIFLCQLSELVSAGPGVKSLGDGEALWRAVDRLK